MDAAQSAGMQRAVSLWMCTEFWANGIAENKGPRCQRTVEEWNRRITIHSQINMKSILAESGIADALC